MRARRRRGKRGGEDCEESNALDTNDYVAGLCLCSNERREEMPQVDIFTCAEHKTIEAAILPNNSLCRRRQYKQRREPPISRTCTYFYLFLLAVVLDGPRSALRE